MQEKGVKLRLRNLTADRSSVKELDELIGDRDPRELLNPRNELYWERNIKEKSPSRAETIRMMAEEPNLLRRPVVISGKWMIPGFDEDVLKNIQ